VSLIPPKDAPRGDDGRSKFGDQARSAAKNRRNPSVSIQVALGRSKKGRDASGACCENSLMLSHSEIWRAIDQVAKRNNLSPSGLAKRAGLDATTFNVSKRQSSAGRLRWPSTESIAKILEATGTGLSDFMAIISVGDASAHARIPVLGFAQAGEKGFFDDAGFPAGNGWEEVDFPVVGDPETYALNVAGDSMLPLYRDGDTLIVSPGANISRGDRIVLRTGDGEVMAKQIVRKTTDEVTLASFNPAFPDRTISLQDVEWMARILWTSQ
jgi:phage repressor protein C with HTH and peptisase S24 domain